MKRFLTLFILITLLFTGCQAFGGGDDDDGGDSGGVITYSSDAVIGWDRDPNNVVFRAHVTGGELANTLAGRNEIPLCTIYGDNRIVWTVNAASTELPQVLYDTLDDQVIINFIDSLTVDYRIYEYETGAELQGTDVVPSVEQLIVNVNDVHHVTDAFAGWDFQYFEEILERCQTLSLTPIEFEPTQAWIVVEAIEFDNTRPSAPLPESLINFEDLADNGERSWLEGDIVRILWAQLRTSAPDIQIEQGGGVYQYALEIPATTIDAPPAQD